MSSSGMAIGISLSHIYLMEFYFSRIVSVVLSIVIYCSIHVVLRKWNFNCNLYIILIYSILFNFADNNTRVYNCN